MRAFFQFLKDHQSGVTSIEYGLIAMAISLSILASYFLIGDALEEIMFTLSSGLEQAQSAVGGGE